MRRRWSCAGHRFATRMETRAWRGVDLVVHPGECVVLTGPSGSGKTTVDAPGQRSGSRLLARRAGGGACASAASMPPRCPFGRAGARRGRAWFQDPASQFFSFELAGRGWRSRARTTGCRHARSLSARMRASPRSTWSACATARSTRCQAVRSSGVAVASAVAPGSRVLVCDEPTANLDADGGGLAGFPGGAAESRGLRRAGVGASAGVAGGHRRSIRPTSKGGQVRWQRSASEMEALSAGRAGALRPAVGGLRSRCPSLRVPRDARTSADGTAPSLEARRLACRRGGHTIWEDVSFRAWPGQVVRSRAETAREKSTLARVLRALLAKARGEVLVGGPRAALGRSAPPGVLRRERHGDAVFHQQRFRRSLLLGRVRDEGVDRPRPRYAGAAGAHAFQGRASRDALGWAAPAPRLGRAAFCPTGRCSCSTSPRAGLDGASMRIVATALSEAAPGGTYGHRHHARRRAGRALLHLPSAHGRAGVRGRARSAEPHRGP